MKKVALREGLWAWGLMVKQPGPTLHKTTRTEITLLFGETKLSGKPRNSVVAEASVFALLRRDKLADRLRLKNFRVVHITSVLEVSL